MLDIFRTISKIADFKTTVLITGESGTGKELVARAIHTRSSRKAAPFVAINCGAIPENLLEIGALRAQEGRLHRRVVRPARPLRGGQRRARSSSTRSASSRSTSRSSSCASLQEESIRRLGDSKDIKVNVRIIAATHRDLAADVKAGRFREDLFYRINVLPIHIPPLRETAART